MPFHPIPLPLSQSNRSFQRKEPSMLLTCRLWALALVMAHLYRGSWMKTCGRGVNVDNILYGKAKVAREL